MTIHIGAKRGEVADAILLPGDPLRARYAAEKYLEPVKRYNDVRNMFGYTGIYEGLRVSVQGTGMGVPSISIYAHELIEKLGVKVLIRVGSCGAMQPDLQLRDVLLAQGACTDSRVNASRFGGATYAALADFELLRRASELAHARELPVRVGNVLTSDLFYPDDSDAWRVWARYGVLAAEMETAELYTVAAKLGARALSILTVSDSMETGEELSSEERERSFDQMIELALALVTSS